MAIRRSDKHRSILPENELEFALAKAMSYCAYQERCRLDVAVRLRSIQITREQTERVIEKLEEDGFINEERFATLYAGGKFRQLHWGKIKIRAGLRSKGIADNIISQALESIDEEKYLQILRGLIASKSKTLSAENDERVNEQKIILYLSSKGFEENLIYQELNKKKY